MDAQDEETERTPSETSEGGADAVIILEPFFPSKGWTKSYDVPTDIIGSQVLFLGSEEDKAELVFDYLTPQGKTWRLKLGFSERGIWIESKLPHHPNQDESRERIASKYQPHLGGSRPNEGA